MGLTQETVLIDIQLQNGEDAAKRVVTLTSAITKLNTERAQMQKQLQALQQDERANAAEIDKVSDQLTRNRQVTADLRNEMRSLDKQLTATSGSLNDQRAALNRLLKEYDNTPKASPKIAKLREEIQKLSAEIRDSEQATGRFQRNVGNYGDALRGLGNSLREGNFRGAAGDAKALFSSVGTAGLALGAAGIAAVGFAKGIASATADAMEFNKAINIMAAENGISRTSEEFAQLKEQALSAGIAYGRSAEEVVDAQNELLKAGVSVNATLAATPSALALASAGNLSLADSASTLARTMTQFNIPATQSGAVADAFAKAANASTASVESLTLAMKYLAPTATGLNVPLNEMLAVAAALDKQGFQGETVSSFATGIKKLAAPTREATEELAKYNIKAFDAKGAFIGMSPLIDELNTKLAGYSQQQRLAALDTIFGGQAGDRFLALMNAGSATINDYTAQINEASKGNGAFTESLAQGKVDSVAKMNASLHSLSITAGQLFAPAVSAAANGLAKFFTSLRENPWINGFSTSTKKAAENTKTVTTEMPKAAAAADRAKFLGGGKPKGGAADGDAPIATKGAPKLKAAEGSLQALTIAAAELKKVIEATPDMATRIAKTGELEAIEKRIKEIQKEIQDALHPKKVVPIVVPIDIEANVDAEQDVPDVIAAIKDKTADADKARMEQEKQWANDTADAKIAAAKRAADEEAKLDEVRNARIMAIAQGVQDIAGSVAQYQSAVQDKAMRDFDEAGKKRLAAVEGNADATKKIEGELAAERDAMEREYAKKQAKMQLVQAGIAGAMAIMSILAAPTIDPTGVLKGIQIAAAVATTAIQIAAIEKGIEGFADGGKISGTRVLPKHGIPIRRSNGDNRLVTVRTNEVVLNEAQQAQLGGADTFRRLGIPGFATGGIVGNSVPPINGGGAYPVSPSLYTLTQAVVNMSKQNPVVYVQDITQVGNSLKQRQTQARTR